MDNETLFSVCNTVVLPGWLLLALAPRWRPGTHLIAPVVLPGLLAIVYLILVVASLGSSDGSFSTLEGVARLFANPSALLAGWIHYLAFDLFIGSWEVRNAQRIGVRHLYVLPCLLLTFLLGPIGLLIYLGVRAGHGEIALASQRT